MRSWFASLKGKQKIFKTEIFQLHIGLTVQRSWNQHSHAWDNFRRLLRSVFFRDHLWANCRLKWDRISDTRILGNWGKNYYNVNHRSARRDCDCRRLASRVLIFTVKYLKIITHDIGRTIIGSENVECHGEKHSEFLIRKKKRKKSSSERVDILFFSGCNPLPFSETNTQIFSLLLFDFFALHNTLPSQSGSYVQHCEEEKKKIVYSSILLLFSKCDFPFSAGVGAGTSEHQNSEEKVKDGRRELAGKEKSEWCQRAAANTRRMYKLLRCLDSLFSSNSRKNCAGLAATKQRRRRKKRSQMFVVCTST